LVGDGEHINAEGKGWIFFHGHSGPRKVIKDVLYVPKMAANLFSVIAALQEGNEITFSDNQVIIKHGDDTIPAYSDGCLFAIELKILKHDQSTRSAYAAYSLESWHKRFGHCGVCCAE